MPIDLEILVNDETLTAPMSRAIDDLNKIQKEFNFFSTPDRLRESAFILTKTKYTKKELFDWLREYKVVNPGRSNHLILAIKQPIEGNLFGSFTPNDLLAVFTIDLFRQFEYDCVRFCTYYLIRYALSFLAPEIRSHQTINCVFDNKIYKKDISLSMNSGNICDTCKGQLQPHLTPELQKAINEMLSWVSRKHPISIIMKGGGVKGLAYAGALKVLGNFIPFDCFVGTSAGAMAAVLLGGNYTPEELESTFSDLKFLRFLDSKILGLWYFVTKRGFFRGRAVEEYIEELLRKKVSTRNYRVRLENLPNRTIVYAAWRGDGSITFDSQKDRKETAASFATRCSISIPYVFIPPKHEGRKIYDGGIKLNFPIERFLSTNHNKPFFGLYLYSESKKQKSIRGDLFSIITEEDVEVLKKHEERIIFINTGPIGTMDFLLSEVKKQFLLASGKLGALEFLFTYYKDSGVTNKDIEDVKSRREQFLKRINRNARIKKVVFIVILSIAFVWISIKYNFCDKVVSWF